MFVGYICGVLYQHWYLSAALPSHTPALLLAGTAVSILACQESALHAIKPDLVLGVSHGLLVHDDFAVLQRAVLLGSSAVCIHAARRVKMCDATV